MTDLPYARALTDLDLSALTVRVAAAAGTLRHHDAAGRAWFVMHDNPSGDLILTRSEHGEVAETVRVRVELTVQR